MSALPSVVARHPGSEADLGPFLDVVTWILLITSALAVLTRLGTKRALRRSLDFDDGFVVAALVCGILVQTLPSQDNAKTWNRESCDDVLFRPQTLLQEYFFSFTICSRENESS